MREGTEILKIWGTSFKNQVQIIATDQISDTLVVITWDIEVNKEVSMF